MIEILWLVGTSAALCGLFIAICGTVSDNND